MRAKQAGLAVALPAALLSACGASTAARDSSTRTGTSTLAAGHIRLAADGAGEAGLRHIAWVAARARAVYANEVGGPRPHSDLRLMAGDRVFLTDLARGDAAAAQAEAKHQMVSNPTDHITRVSVVRGARMIVNAVWNHNGSFVVAPLQAPLHLRGRSLGTLMLSVQDVVGYIKLIHAYTGAWAVVRGSSGQVRASLPAAEHVSLPRSGLSTVAGRRYAVSSFSVGGWQKEELTVWVLAPT
jgi:hypothetical protein